MLVHAMKVVLVNSIKKCVEPFPEKFTHKKLENFKAGKDLIE